MQKRIRRYEAPQRETEGAEAPCDVPGCTGQGLYRAPKSRQNLRDYYWFCLDHVRDYNRQWDYYAGMSQAEIESHIRRDSIWDRPTWRLGSDIPDDEAKRFHDPFGFFTAEEAARRARENGSHPDVAQPDTVTARAFAVFDLTPPASLADIKARYKRLVKRFHPDANGGDKMAEDRLKLINQAYRTLKDWVAQNAA